MYVWSILQLRYYGISEIRAVTCVKTESTCQLTDPVCRLAINNCGIQVIFNVNK